MEYTEYEELRKKTDLKNSDVARLAKIPPSTFTDWKQGKSKPKEEKLGKILAVLYAAGPVPSHSKTKEDVLCKELASEIVLKNKIPEKAASQSALSDEYESKLKELSSDQRALIESMIDKMLEMKKK